MWHAANSSLLVFASLFLDCIRGQDNSMAVHSSYSHLGILQYEADNYHRSLPTILMPKFEFLAEETNEMSISYSYQTCCAHDDLGARSVLPFQFGTCTCQSVALETKQSAGRAGLADWSRARSSSESRFTLACPEPPHRSTKKVNVTS